MPDSDRDSIFGRIRESLATASQQAPYPEYEDEVATAKRRFRDGDTLWETFATNFSAVNGRPMTELAEVIDFLKSEGATVGYCDPTLEESIGRVCQENAFEIHCHFERERFDDYQFGITRASAAIAETGTLVLTDSDTSDRLGALTPWIHIAVLPESRLVSSVAQAIAGFGRESNIIWATGPSKTADVEGILIEGVHGPGEQICLKTAGLQ